MRSPQRGTSGHMSPQLFSYYLFSILILDGLEGQSCNNSSQASLETNPFDVTDIPRLRDSPDFKTNPINN
jgi:hypothetical protein